MFQALALAFGLAMDATAVAAVRGVANHRRDLIALPLLFGGFQSGMAALGWLGGDAITTYFDGWDRWVSFIVLALIGIKMIVDGVKQVEGHAVKPPGLGMYLALAIATSLDAAAAGLSLSLIPLAPQLSILLIGVVTAVLTVVGFLVGKAIGARFGGKLVIAGGIVLVAIGLHLLLASR